MTEWQEKTMAHWALINKMTARRFGSGAVAEEAALFVLDALRRENWKKVEAFAARSSFQTFLRSVVYRLLEDFARRKFGRLRPPQWVRRLGGAWLELYRYLCLERLSVVEAVERCANALLCRRRLEEQAWEIKERIADCGGHVLVEVELDDTVAECGAGTPEEALDARQREELLRHLGQIMTEGGERAAAGRFDRLLDLPFALTSQEKLLLRMRYVDGLSVAAIGDMLGWNRHQTNGRLRRLMTRLRQVIEEAGVADEFRACLHD